MYKCTNCSHTSASKLGRCPWCWEFGTFEQDTTSKSYQKSVKKKSWAKWNQLEITTKQEKISFLDIKHKEFGRIFKRWIKKSWLYLIWWEPGIGKSTIVLQLLDELIANNKDMKIAYFSGEENVDQITDRITRLNLENLDKNLDIYYATHLEDIMTTTEIGKYNFMIIDSIQTVYSSHIDSTAWSPWQVRACSEVISEFSKKNKITTFIVWHVTKWGEIAGPKYLEHIVDAVLQLEWDRFGQYRFLRTQKNRFDSTDDVAIFEMSLFGLQPVYDLKERIINQANTTMPGHVLTVGIDNARAVIVSLEVLLNKSKFKYPQRTAIWIDANRLNLITAILERYLKINIWYFDIYVNIPWEFKFYDSGLDLAIAFAIYSQYKNKIPDKNNIYIWEIWLGWQVLKSKLHEKRSKEMPEWFHLIDHTGIKNIVEINNFI